ncbi:zinc finger MYM-type protein 1-like [Homarus americanus]|uniref:zinc finger MYM-type protein 1-like n=1 Tax=Homarus americanus TaxID=6706 RepID=UPI001C4774D1|nr:zinc finger MYM-type protein 1-like [Homarus americanus]
MAEEGINDWKNASHLLSTHESSIEHTKNMTTWKELEVNIARGRTIDQREMESLMVEWNRWRQVLTRLVEIIQSLAERNLALRGSTEKLNCPSNGNFFQEVELLAKFDPVMKNHLIRVESNAGNHSHTHYLGQMIQNELINVISAKITERFVDDIKASKYFSIILDCTPDLSHKEQLSVIIRIVALEDKPTIKEHFLGFL